MSSSMIAADVLSYIALACMTFMLLPQAYLHVKHQSTQGLSSLMLILFLIASLMSGTYDYLVDQPAAITLAWAGFSIFAIVCLCQVKYYDPSNITNRSLYQRRVRFTVLLLVSIAVCCATCAAVYFVLVASVSAHIVWVPEAFGYIVPIALNVAAYCVQFRLIIVSKDSSGISLGFMSFDLSAGTISIIAIALDDWDGAAAAPYFLMIGMQGIMAILYFVVYPVTSPVKQTIKSVKLSQVELVDMNDIHSVVTDSPDSRSDPDSDYMFDSDSEFELDSDDESNVRIHVYDEVDGQDFSHSINRTILQSMNMSDHWVSAPRAVQPIR